MNPKAEDDLQLMRRQSPLADQVAEILLERISSGTYPPESRLPSENELVEELNVSRATVRAALSALAANGMVKRRHGVGTFISRLTRISNPLNDVIDYNDLITGQGFAYRSEHLSSIAREPEQAVREALDLKEGASAVEIWKAFLANDEMVICTLNVIPAWVYEGRITTEEILRPGATEPLYQFLEDRCGQAIDYYVGAVRPDIARNIHVRGPALNVNPLMPVLVIEEVGYNPEEKPVIYEVEHLFGDRMKFDVIRRHRRAARR